MNNYQKLNRVLFHHKKLSLALIVVALALIVAKPIWRALAAPGDLDTMFSGDGRYTLPLLNIGSETGYARLVSEIRIQTDANNIQTQNVIVPYGNKPLFPCPSGPTTYDFLVTRLTSSGAKDNTFGNNGIRTISFAGLPGVIGGKSYVTALELQSNGKILLAGQLETCNQSLVGLARLTYDGDMDTTFGTGGKIVLNGVAEAYDMAVSNGKILLVGKVREWNGSSAYPWISAVWRFNADGTPDTTFSSDGMQTFSVWPDTATNNGGAEGFKSIFIQADGKITVLNSTSSGYRLRRFNSTGSVDNTLQANGLSGEYGNTVRAGNNSNIWVVGAKETQGVKYGAIFSRSMSNGNLDGTYGGGTGKVISAQASEWQDMASLSFTYPQKYIVAGWNTYPDSNILGINDKAVLLRYSATGVLDTSFGANGSVETADFESINGGGQTHPMSRYYSVRTGLNGKIVTGGAAGTYQIIPPIEYGVVARHLNN